MFNHHDINRDACMLHGPLAHHGYDWWWHSFSAQDAATGEDKPFFIEFFICNPALGGDEPVLGQRTSLFSASCPRTERQASNPPI